MNWIDYTKQKPTDKDAQYLIIYGWNPNVSVHKIVQWNGNSFFNFDWDEGNDIMYGDKVKYWMKIEEPTEEQDMELKQAIEICKEMQKWRRGEGIYDGESPAPMPYTPETYGIALDKLIEHAGCNSGKNLQEFDADYLQSKIDAFTEARRKDGKTADDLLNECRGGSLELTWQDVKRIVEIADDIIGKAYYENMSEEEYYTEVLRRFKENE